MRELSLLETRVIGALIEKKITTPDQYPLSLNALVNACNQKSSREPILNLSDQEVQEVVDDLIQLNLVAEVSIGSRVKKYQHRFCNTEFSKLHLASDELAIVCCLFLRGPQTPGELRGRTARLYEFPSVDNVENSLLDLINRKDGPPLVYKLPKEPGRREIRYMHLFSGELELDEMPAQSSPQIDKQHSTSASDRIAALEEQVLKLQNEVESLKRHWEELNA